MNLNLQGFGNLAGFASNTMGNPRNEGKKNPFIQLSINGLLGITFVKVWNFDKGLSGSYFDNSTKYL